MIFSLRPIIGFLITALMASQAFANSTTVTASPAGAQQPKKAERLWNGLFNVGRSSSLYDFGDGSRRDGMEYMARLNFKMNEIYTLRAQAGYAQDLKYPEYNDFSDTSLSLLRAPQELGKAFLLGYRVGMNLPTSKDSHVRQNLQTSLSAGLSISVNPDRLIPGLKIAGSLGLGRNFHEFETALDGKVNTQQSATQSVSLSYSFKAGVSVSADFLQRTTWSYQNAMRQAFEMSQELGYQANPTWAFAVGHSNSGSTLKPNGADSNVQVFDDKNSVVYASTTVIF